MKVLDETTKPRKKKVAWTKVDPPLMLAAMAPTIEKKRTLIARIAERHNTTPAYLQQRLEWLGMRHVCIEMGYAAIDQWEKQAKALATLMRERDRLERAIFKRAMNLRNDLHKQEHRAISVKDAAMLLKLDKTRLRRYILDLKLIELDGNGKIPLAELRRFYWEDGRWLLKSQRFLKKEGLRN